MGHTCDWDSFINIHKPQLMLSGIPAHFWKTLYDKLFGEIFDIGKSIELVKFDKEYDAQENHIWGLQTISALDKSDPHNIFLIDHAWTFRLENAKQQLLENEHLRNRMCSMLDLDRELSVREICEQIYNKMWPLCNTYSISSALEAEDRLPIWYIMDEIGSALIHNDSPNCRIVPFYFSNEQITYSLLFPVENIEEGSFLFRDFAEGIIDKTKRKVALIPWVSCTVEDISMIPQTPGPKYYLEGHIQESLPNIDNYKNFSRKNMNKLKVFTQYSLIRNWLTSDSFEIVDNEDEADILWLTEHFKNYNQLSFTPEKFINQFPFEYVITIKDLLNLTCRNSNEKNIDNYWPKWIPKTYNLKTELEHFIALYKDFESRGMENYWILKPFNLARGMDTHITNNLNCIIRLASTSPKIIQEYITKPVLFNRTECEGYVKFDIRYVLLLKSIKPLKAYIYRNFFLRFANEPFELNDFEVYEKHFTVMNYRDDASLRHMLCDEFLREWAEQYSHYDWKDIEKSICVMLKEILLKATCCDPPCGIADSFQSRALYAADIMLEWNEKSEIRPKILEINWTPDCKRACEYYPNFFNDIFSLLFLDRDNTNILEL